MFAYIRYIVTVIFAGIITYFLIISTLSISSSVADESGSLASDDAIEFSMASIGSDGNIQISPLEASENRTNFPAEESFPADATVQVSFGRLATAFVLPTFNASVADFKKWFERSGENTLKIWDISGVFSFYDPFKNYTIQDAKGRYAFEAITNGSVYFGPESDGTISVYSVDSIGELSFLAEGKKMSDIIIFPGMYVRFNPEKNTTLEWADILQIMQELQKNTDGANTGIEFADPRIKTSSQDSTYFMYRLPTNTKVLFKMLQKSFEKKVATVKLLEQYSADNIELNPDNVNNGLINPTKKMHRILGELQFVLSQTVTDSDMDMEDFKSEYEKILEKAESLEKENMIEGIMKQFLIDGRFALFLQKDSLRYEKIYNAVASIVGVAPTSGKWKLFESLSAVFSENLLQKESVLSGIHTYLEAVNELQKMMTVQGMENKDYMDLSLYGFKIFEKMRDLNNHIDASALEDEEGTIFELYTMLIKSTQKYAKSLWDVQKQEAVQRELVNIFYTEMMQQLQSSIYGNYVLIEDEKLYLRPEIVDKDEAQMSITFRTSLSDVIALMESTYTNQLESAFENKSALEQKNLQDLNTNIIRLKWFLAMIQKNAYKGYKKDPYVALSKKTALPLIENGTIIRSSQYEKETENATSNSNVSDLFATDSKENTPEDEPETTQSANKNTREIEGVEVQYTKENGLFSGLSFQIWDQKVTVIGQFNSPKFEIFLLDVPAYKSQIESILSSRESVEKLSIIAPQNMILIGSDTYFLEK